MRSLFLLPFFLSLGILLTCRVDKESKTQGGPLAVEGLYRDSLSLEPTVLELKRDEQLIARLTLPYGYLQDHTRVRMWVDTPDVVIDRIFGVERMPTVSIEYIDRFGKVASVFGEASLEIAVDEPLRLELQKPDSEWTGIYEMFHDTGLAPRMFAPGEPKRRDGMVRVPVFGSSRVTVGRLSPAVLQNRPPRPLENSYVPYLKLVDSESTDDERIPRCLPSVYGAVTPANGDIEVDLDKPISMTFTTTVDEASLLSAFKVENVATGAALPGTVSYNSTSKVLTFTPTADYPQKVQLQVRIASGLKLSDGYPVSTGVVAKFTTLSRSTLLAQWRFDGNGNDSSGNNRNITGSNVTYDSSVKVQGSSSASFNGTTSYFDLGVFDFGNKFTVTVWIYLPSTVKFSLNTILANGNGGILQNGFKFFINEYNSSNLTVVTEAGNGLGGSLRKTATNFVTTGSWKHLAFLLDKTATSANNRVNFYFNGTKASQAGEILDGNATEFPNDFGTNRQAYIGRFPTNFGSGGADNFMYEGRMDDFRVYNTLLSDDEISQIATQQ
jgi:hypothetical protein